MLPVVVILPDVRLPSDTYLTSCCGWLESLFLKATIFETAVMCMPHTCMSCPVQAAHLLINLWMSVDNRHGCFSLQYSAHLACLSVLTRQVKWSPAAFLTSLTLFFNALLLVVVRSPPIHRSFIQTLCFRGCCDVTHRSSWRRPVKVDWPTGKSVDLERNHSRP